MWLMRRIPDMGRARVADTRPSRDVSAQTPARWERGLVIAMGAPPSLDLATESPLLVGSRVTEQLSVETLPVLGDTSLGCSQADATRADQPMQPRVEPVLDRVPG